MELSWSMKLRIGAAAAVGILIIGVLAWPIAAPADPLGTVSLIGNSLTFGNAVILVGLAVLTGFIAYFLSWPYGRQIGVIAVPFGLAVWALRSGGMTNLIRAHQGAAQRLGLFESLKWEPLFWLVIVIAGFLGVLAGSAVHRKTRQIQVRPTMTKKSSKYVNWAIAIIVTVLVAQFCIVALGKDISIYDARLGSVVSEPANSQIAFATAVSFLIAAFLVKILLGVGYIWPTISSALLTAFVTRTYLNQDLMEHLSANWPVVFLPNSAGFVLPIQMVCFGTLGSIAGYWLAVQYKAWRQECKK